MNKKHSFLIAIATLPLAFNSSPSSRELDKPRQETQSTHFDLVVYGFDFDDNEHEIYLRTNPAIGGEWETVGTLAADAESDSNESWSAIVLPHLSTERYLGQDIRENYLAVKIVSTDSSDESALAAIYALPHYRELDQGARETIVGYIEEEPATIERFSLASYVRPRPASLGSDVVFIDHVEAPVRHLKPGVLEVEWLELLFSNR